MLRLVILCALLTGFAVINSTPNSAFATPLFQGQAAPKADKRVVTAEQVAETTIFFYGSRPVLTQIRRNGVERGRITRFTGDGKTEESTYERRFVRGESLDKDKVRIDQRAPTL